MQRSNRIPNILPVAALLIVAALASPPALARERHSSVTGPQGKTVQHDSQRQQGDVTSSTTGPNGETLGQRQVDRSTSGTTAAVSGPQGKKLTRKTAVQVAAPTSAAQ